MREEGIDIRSETRNKLENVKTKKNSTVFNSQILKTLNSNEMHTNNLFSQIFKKQPQKTIQSLQRYAQIELQFYWCFI